MQLRGLVVATVVILVALLPNTAELAGPDTQVILVAKCTSSTVANINVRFLDSGVAPGTETSLTCDPSLPVDLRIIRVRNAGGLRVEMHLQDGNAEGLCVNEQAPLPTRYYSSCSASGSGAGEPGSATLTIQTIMR